MMADVLTVARKEFSEGISNPKTRRQALLGAAFAVVFIDVVYPLMVGDFWQTAFMAVGLSAFVTIVGPMFGTVDTLAGERERHTLETLLATRLPNRAIALGKLAAIVFLQVTTAWVFAIQGIIAAALWFGHWQSIGIPLLATLAIPTVGTLLCILVTALGMLVSMRAQTVQGAQQTLGLVMIPFFMIPAFIFPLLTFGAAQVLPANDAASLLVLVGASAVGVLILLDALMLTLLLKLFTRFRLMRQ